MHGKFRITHESTGVFGIVAIETRLDTMEPAEDWGQTPAFKPRIPSSKSEIRILFVPNFWGPGQKFSGSFPPSSEHWDYILDWGKVEGTHIDEVGTAWGRSSKWQHLVFAVFRGHYYNGGSKGKRRWKVGRRLKLLWHLYVSVNMQELRLYSATSFARLCFCHRNLAPSSRLGEVSFRLAIRKSLSPVVVVRRACAEEAAIFAGY